MEEASFKAVANILASTPRKGGVLRGLSYLGPKYIKQTYVPSSTGFTTINGNYYGTGGASVFVSAASSSMPAMFEATFYLSDLPQAASITALWDIYRVRVWELSHTLHH